MENYNNDIFIIACFVLITIGIISFINWNRVESDKVEENKNQKTKELIRKINSAGI